MLKETSENWFFQHNDPKHTPKVVIGWLSVNKVQVLDWSFQSADLNPIGHLSGELKDRIKKYRRF
mgnify:CR=1 FL=1